MKDTLLPWERIGWTDFQKLTIHFAQSQIADQYFEEYLKQGNEQDGVDIISTILTDGKYIAIQCKHERLNKSKIREIVHEFRNGIHFNNCHRFIVATTSDLQKADIQKEIIAIKNELYKSKITFEVWDTNYVSEQLRGQKTLVQFYFSKQIANEHCQNYLNPKSWKKNNPVDDFINRRVSIFDANRNYDSYQERLFFQKDNYYLTSIFTENRLMPNHICLVADAHLGKTVCLKQLAYDLEQIDTPYKCFFLELKHQPLETIESILNAEYYGWDNIPNRDIVIFLDGLDEVESTSFRNFAKNINIFQKTNHQVNIIFSSRKLFYKHYNIEEFTNDFKVLELLPLYDADIEEFLNRQLGRSKISFERKINNAHINNLLFHPFYLTFLVKKYKVNPVQLPHSKLEIIKLFVEQSYSVSLNRETSGGNILSHEQYQFKKVVQKFAFTLQLLGLNAIEDIDLQKVFSLEDRTLLRHSSLIGFYNNKWSFDNAIFQEHLAGIVLADMDITTIIATISIGKWLKKIKAKWIQTVASLLSFLSKSSDTYQKLLTFILEDNIELIFTTEESKFSTDEKIDFLNKLFARCKKYKIRPQIIDTRTIASFIESSNECKNIVINQIADEQNSIGLKTTCINVLGIMELTFQQKVDLYNVCKKSINETNDSYYQREVLETLASHNIGDRTFINNLIRDKSKNEQHDYRQGVYKLISSLELYEQYYDYALEGISFLVHKNKGVTHSGSEFTLEELLFATNKYENIVLLLFAMNSEEWLEYYKYTYRKSHFIKKLAITLANIHQENPLILLHVVEFVKELGRKYTREDYQEINTFFDLTNTNAVAFKLLGKEFFAQHYWQYGDLVNETCLEYSLYEFDDNQLTIEELTYIYYSIPNSNNDLKNIFLNLYHSVTGVDFFNKSSIVDEYQQQEITRFENDMKYIKSKEAFTSGINSFFNAYGSDSIPEDDIYIDVDDNKTRIRKDSYLISMFLYNWVETNDNKVYLKTCLERLNQEGLFEYFRIEEILSHPYKQEKFTSISRTISSKYFYKNLPKCNFENCIWETLSNEGSPITKYRTLEMQMGQLFRHYQFDLDLSNLMEFIWLDDGGVRKLDIEHDPFYNKNHKKSFTEIILEKIKPNELSDFRQKVMLNLNIGIRFESVLATHISICRHFKIIESLPLILKFIFDRNISNRYRSSYIEIYLELGGDYSLLLPLLQEGYNIDDYSFRALISKLYKTNDNEVKLAMLQYLSNPEADNETKIQTAKYLCYLGEKSGFDYLLSIIEKTGKSPYTIQGNISISNVDTKYALKKLDKHATHLLVRAEDSKFFESTQQIMLEWLYSFGRKSEEDTDLVYRFFLKHEKKLNTKHINAPDLFWYAFKVIENYRELDTNNKTIEDVRKILQEL